MQSQTIVEDFLSSLSMGLGKNFNILNAISESLQQNWEKETTQEILIGIERKYKEETTNDRKKDRICKS